jgi:hypothetical protein
LGFRVRYSAQPQKACNHEYHDDYTNDVKYFDPPTRSVTLPAASDHIGIPGVGGRLGNYQAQVVVLTNLDGPDARVR